MFYQSKIFYYSLSTHLNRFLIATYHCLKKETMVQQADKQLAQSDCYVSVKCLKCKWKCQNVS